MEMIRELGNVEFFELCETTQKRYNVLTVFFNEIKELSTAPADTSWLKANSEERTSLNGIGSEPIRFF